jgi:hypothetical protein
MKKYFLNHRNEWTKIDDEKDIFVPGYCKLNLIELHNDNLQPIGIGYYISKK